MTNRILIADDNLLVRQMLAQQLEAIGYPNSAKAVNGADAFNQLVEAHEKGTPFRIVVIDWMMPIMNGLDFLTKCRADPRFSKTAIVMVSAECEDHNILKSLEAGATCYLGKPYTVPLLEEKIKQAEQWLKSIESGSKVASHA